MWGGERGGEWYWRRLGVGRLEIGEEERGEGFGVLVCRVGYLVVFIIYAGV